MLDMKDNKALNIIARIKTDFPTKFGIPRQSGLVQSVKGRIVFEKEYRNLEALRGLEGYSHLWIIWKFSEAEADNWSPTVRPPRLGGNKRMGVFATRSPFRPNPIGLSSVKIERIIEKSGEGPQIEVSGADMLDGTPIYDIKPYIAYTDSHPEALGGFSTDVFENKLKVEFGEGIEDSLPKEILEPLKEILESDPRPSYQNNPERIYSFEFANYHIEFKVNDDELNVILVEDLEK